MTVHVFKSTDAGAPVLTGQVSKLVDLLTAVGVDGYNSQAGVTATQTGGTATFTKTAHGFVVNQRLTITGFTTSDYNLTTARVLTVPTANTWTMAIDAGAASPAVGTGTAIVAPCGWTKSYTGTNKAAFRTPLGSNQFYLRVDDTNAQYSILRGYETMSDVDTGTNLFPTAAQSAAGLYLYKSGSADATARAWKVYTDGKMLIFLNEHGASVNRWAAFMFGDIHTYKGGDVYATILRAEVSSAAPSAALCFATAGHVGSTQTGAYIARAYTGTAGAVTHGLVGDYTLTGGATYIGSANAGCVYPDPIAGGLNMHPVRVSETAVLQYRGIVPGVWGSNAPWGSIAAGDTFTGALGTPLAGVDFESVLTYSSATGAWLLIDVSGETWDTAYG